MIKVSPSQKGNVLLSEMNSSSWHFDASLTVDYEVNFSTGILFLSLKFYASKPEYIFKRLNKIKKYKLTVLLVLIDTPNYNKSLLELFRMIPIAIVLAKDFRECVSYLKGFDSSASDGSLRQKDSNTDNFLLNFFSKSEVVRIKKNFKSINELVSSDVKGIYGVGKQKAKNFEKYSNMPFH